MAARRVSRLTDGRAAVVSAERQGLQTVAVASRTCESESNRNRTRVPTSNAESAIADRPAPEECRGAKPDENGRLHERFRGVRDGAARAGGGGVDYIATASRRRSTRPRPE